MRSRARSRRQRRQKHPPPRRRRRTWTRRTKSLPRSWANRSDSPRVAAGKHIMQQIRAIIGLTWKAAVRYRLFWVLTCLLVAAVVALPLLIKDDGTAEGLAQIVVTYTMGAVTAILGICTLWLSCGLLARDIEDCQMQVL